MEDHRVYLTPLCIQAWTRYHNGKNKKIKKNAKHLPKIPKDVTINVNTIATKC